MTTRVTGQEIAERQTEAVNRHDLTAFAAGYALDTRAIDPVYPEPLSGREAVKKDMADFFTAFPDLHFERTGTLVDGDTLVWEGVMSGTNLGPLALPTGLVPATNRKVAIRMCGIGSINGAGEISEERRYYDVAGLLDQLGLMQ
jgi:hypothetical protein